MQKNDAGERVLVLAPVGQDASVMAQLFASHGFATQICRAPEECCEEIEGGAGALILTEEALEMEGAFSILNAMQAQPTWSELPLIILTTGGESRLTQLLDLTAAAAGTVTLLERPISTTTLLRSVEVALNSRWRQYQVRDLFEEQRRTELQLRQAHERLSDHARELETLVQERTANLAESNQQLRSEMIKREKAEAAREALRRQLINAQEEERRRIARELHDQMGQNLTALNLGLRSLEEIDPCCDALSARVAPLQELAAQTARDLHRVALELRPTALDDLGLVKALRSLIETWSRNCRIEADFEPGDYDATGISSEIETTLYRVIQEALNNVAKHAEATRVSLVLRRLADQVQAIVEDDGRGFDASSALESSDGRGRLGLVGVQERLVLLGGSLDLESAAGEGTTFVVRIPIAKSA